MIPKEELKNKNDTAKNSSLVNRHYHTLAVKSSEYLKSNGLHLRKPIEITLIESPGKM